MTIAFLAALCGAFIMRSAQSAERRLVVAGYRPIDAVLPRLLVLAAATITVLVVSLAVTALSFTPASWPAFIAGKSPRRADVRVYRCSRRQRPRAARGDLSGAVSGGARYRRPAEPMFGDRMPGRGAYAFPDYGPGRVVVDGHSLPASMPGWSLRSALGWLVALALALAGLLRHVLRRVA